MHERGTTNRATKFSKYSVYSLKYKHLQQQKITTNF